MEDFLVVETLRVMMADKNWTVIDSPVLSACPIPPELLLVIR